MSMPPPSLPTATASTTTVKKRKVQVLKTDDVVGELVEFAREEVARIVPSCMPYFTSIPTFMPCWIFQNTERVITTFMRYFMKS